MTSGNSLKQSGMAAAADHNKYWFTRAMQELYWMRHRKQAEFTFEDLTPTLERLIGSRLPASLGGTITHHAIKRGIFVPLDKRRPSVDPERHGNKVEVYRWGKNSI